MTFFKNIKIGMNKLKYYDNKLIDIILSLVISILLSLIIVSGFATIIINLMIIKIDYRLFLSFVLGFIFSLFIFLSIYFWLKSISKGEIKEIKNIALFISIISFIFVIILIVIFIMIGVY